MKVAWVRRRYLALVLMGLVIANVLLYRAIFTPRVVKMTVFQSSKSAATLLQTPHGGTVLIDTGSDASILRELGTALPPWQRSLNAAVLTSSSASSIGGLEAVTSRYHVQTIEKSPYGKHLVLDGVTIETLSTSKSPAVKVTYGAASLTISSSTPSGVYTSDGKTFR